MKYTSVSDDRTAVDIVLLWFGISGNFNVKLSPRVVSARNYKGRAVIVSILVLCGYCV